MERMHDSRKFDDCDRWTAAFARRYPESAKMLVSGLKANIMFAARQTGDGRHDLPIGVPAPAYPVALYEGCPSGWVTEGAFFVPIPLDAEGLGPGMWYDWTENADGEFDVAVVPSTTGLNPITGQKADKLRLERYVEQCPVHRKPFEPVRLCEECGFAWPPQNYVAEPNTLWWDGFKRPDGTVHQFFFTTEMVRDVGIAALGKDRVPAFGFAFFRSKAAKPKRVMFARRAVASGSPLASGPGWEDDSDAAVACAAAAVCCMPLGMGGIEEIAEDHLDGLVGAGVEPPGAGPKEHTRETLGIRRVAVSCRVPPFAGAVVAPAVPAVAPPARSQPRAFASETRCEAIMDRVGVGAGALIEQDLEEDPHPLEHWQDEAAAVTTVYFVSEAVAEQILTGPKRDIIGDRRGYLGQLPVRVGTD